MLVSHCHHFQYRENKAYSQIPPSFGGGGGGGGRGSHHFADYDAWLFCLLSFGEWSLLLFDKE